MNHPFPAQVDVRVFYRTSPPASDRWVRYYDYAKAHSLDRTKTPERRPWMRAGGGCEAPLANASAVYACVDSKASTRLQCSCIRTI